MWRFVTPVWDTGLPKDATFFDRYVGTTLARFAGRLFSWKRPGRQQGLYDYPNVKLFGKIDPSDVVQRQIGDCWLLSVIACIAEFPEGAKGLLENTTLSKEGHYRVRLFDIPTRKFVWVAVDDRLAVRDPGSTAPYSCQITLDGEIWPAIVEKACAAHAGGWDQIHGGDTMTAFALLTGSLKSVFISRQGGVWMPYTRSWQGWTSNNPPTQVLDGSDWDANINVWRTEPKTDDEFVDQLAVWDFQGFLICGGSPGTSDQVVRDGIVDNHAYSVLSIKTNVADTGLNFLLLRNPHGRTEFEGSWHDADVRWETPDGKQVRAVLEEEFGRLPVADDGIFWMESKDAFQKIPTWTVCLSGQKRKGKARNSKPPEADTISAAPSRQSSTPSVTKPRRSATEPAPRSPSN